MTLIIAVSDVFTGAFSGPFNPFREATLSACQLVLSGVTVCLVYFRHRWYLPFFVLASTWFVILLEEVNGPWM